MRFALWPNLTQAVGRRSGAPPLNTTVPAICEPRTHRLPTPAGPDPRPFSATFPAEATLPHHVVSYGPDIPNEQAYRLLGNVGGQAGARARLRRRTGLDRARPPGPLIV